MEANIRIRRSWWSVLPNFIIAGIVVGAVHRLSTQFNVYGLEIPLSSIEEGLVLVLPFYWLIGFFMLARPLFLMRDTKHVLSQHHLYCETGRMSLKREHVEIAFEEMLGVRFKQGLVERILDVGTILVWTASADHPEIIMGGVRHPEQVVHQIRQRIDDSLLRKKAANQN